MKKVFTVCLSMFILLGAWLPGVSAAAVTTDEARPYVNSIGMEFVRIPAGSFTRSFTKTNALNVREERQSKFIISKDFYMGKFQVTQEQWDTVMGKNPSEFKGPSNPVENVSWDDVQEFIRVLNAREGGARYRLPTEAEWELAAGGGAGAAGWNDAAGPLNACAWLGANSEKTTHPVGEKTPSAYGPHDMYGNVWEWMQDWYLELPEDSELTDYLGQAEDSLHVLRGGCWICTPEIIRSGNRSHGLAGKRNSHIGFRLAFSAE